RACISGSSSLVDCQLLLNLGDLFTHHAKVYDLGLRLLRHVVKKILLPFNSDRFPFGHTKRPLIIRWATSFRAPKFDELDLPARSWQLWLPLHARATALKTVRTNGDVSGALVKAIKSDQV